MKKKIDWPIPIGLILLCIIPILGGVARINDLLGNAKITPDNERFFTAPKMVIVHIIISCIFGIVGAFQFSPGFRKQNSKWHRTVGKPLIAFGLISALTGLWLTFYFPRAIGDGPTLYYVRLIVGFSMTLFIFMSIFAIQNRNFKKHGEWMMRGYGLGLGAGTQVFTHLPWILVIGTLPTGLVRDAAMASGWLINFLVVEWIIRRKLSLKSNTALETA
jgi:uncharacterized membrane protein